MALDVEYDGFGFLQTRLALALAFMSCIGAGKQYLNEAGVLGLGDQGESNEL